MVGKPLEINNSLVIVILSVAKDLVAARRRHEILRYAQDDKICGDSMPDTHRDPIVRTVPHPSDMNGNGDIFGGWVLSQMDTAGGALAGRVAKGRVATVAITAMTFV